MSELDEVLDGWQAWQEAQGLSPRTIEERAAALRRYVVATGEPPLGITPRGITRFIGRPGLKPRTRWAYRQHLASFSSYLIAAKLRPDDPIVDVPAVKKPLGVPRPVEPHQLAAALALATGPSRMMILLAAYAGLRVHEIAKFRGRDLDRKAGTIYVEGKGGVEAVIPAHPAILEEAAGYPERDWWFPARAGGPITRQQVSAAIRGALAAAGADASAHQLRHTFGTALVDAGADVRVIQELMRHATLGSTQIYTRVSATQRAAAIARLPGPDPRG